MTFFDAKQRAARGALIKRPHWDNPLRARDGHLEFVTAVLISNRRHSRSYVPTKIDAAASDWEVV